jgi:hypothetical protein
MSMSAAAKWWLRGGGGSVKTVPRQSWLKVQKSSFVSLEFLQLHFFKGRTLQGLGLSGGSHCRSAGQSIQFPVHAD